MDKKYLFAILLLAAAIRFYPMIEFSYPIGIDSYYHIRLSEYFTHGFVSYDPLSFGGRPYVYPPGMHIMTAILHDATTLPISFLVQVVPTLFSLAGIAFVYLITKKLYNEKTGLIAAFLFAMTPVAIWKTASNGLVTAVDMTLLLAAFFMILEKNYKVASLTTIILLVFSPIVALFAAMLLILSNRGYGAAVLVLCVAIVALNFNAVSNIYLTKDVPADLKSGLYEPFSLDTVYHLGLLIPLGLIPLFWKKKNNLLALWLVLLGFMVVFNFVETDRGLFYLSVPLSINAALVLSNKKVFPAALAIVLVLSSLAGAVAVDRLFWPISTVSPEERQAMFWLKYNTPQNSTVLATIFEGHWITGIGERKSVIDGNIIAAPNLTDRYEAVKSIYLNQSRKELIDKYKIDYIILSGREQIYGETVPFDYRTAFSDGDVRVLAVKSD